MERTGLCGESGCDGVQPGENVEVDSQARGRGPCLQPSVPWSRCATQTPFGALRAGSETARVRKVLPRDGLYAVVALSYAALIPVLPQPVSIALLMSRKEITLSAIHSMEAVGNGIDTGRRKCHPLAYLQNRAAWMVLFVHLLMSLTYALAWVFAQCNLV